MSRDRESSLPRLGYFDSRFICESLCSVLARLLEGYSKSSVDSEGGQNEYQGVDDGPDKRYPGRHFKVSRLIDPSKPMQSQY